MGIRATASLFAILALAGCVSLVADYDPTFDQSLNKLSEDTSTFLASAGAGGPQRLAASPETTAYYSSTYNLLDRLSLRASVYRSQACLGNEALAEFAGQSTTVSELPPDYLEFDCREAQLYYVRYFVDQLHYGQTEGGTLNPSERRALGRQLQTSILGAIRTFLVNKV